MEQPKLVSVIGPNKETCTNAIYDFGLELGKVLVDNGYFIVCGGMHGVMEAVCRGAKNSENYSAGCTLGIIPFLEKSKANQYCDIVIPTGIGIARNQLVVNSGDAVVAVAGGAGTLSEIAFAWQFNKPVICYTGLGGWSEQFAGVKVDTKRQDKILEAKSLDEIINHLKKLV